MNLTLAEISHVLETPIIHSNDHIITSASFDSRKSQSNSLFVPLIAANDGHNYVQNAINNGATATLWQADHQELLPDNIAVFVVPDTLAAFQKIAAYYLEQVQPKIIAISGSNGKTTTKDLIASIGRQSFRTIKTPANFNNEIGVPATILSMPKDTELLVIEFGMDRPGDLTSLSELVHPDITVLTMIGEAHIEFFKTRDRIADGKMEIINGMKPNGVLIYNGDERLLRERAAIHPHLRTITFGLSEQNDFYATDIKLSPVQADFELNNSTVSFQIPLTGRYNVSNALAAIAVGHQLNLSDEQISTALAHAEITENRTEWLPGKFGGKILSDVYNSNPTAAKEVLKFFSESPTNGRRIAILGDMLELGSAGPALHAGLADSFDPNQIEHVYLVGDIITSLEQVLTQRYPKNSVKRYAKDEQNILLTDLQADLKANDLVMLKGSHGIHLENVVQALRAD